MKSMKVLGLFACAFGLSGCLTNDTERGLAGAAGGAVIADVTGGNAPTGGAIGGPAGGVCQPPGGGEERAGPGRSARPPRGGGR